MRYFHIIVLSLALGACATMNEDECRVADWRSVGYEDGVSGRSASRVGEYRESCAEYGVRPDMQAYRQGREDGLREFCRPQKGYQLGRRGGSYAGVCPSELAGEFQAAYNSGKRIYGLETSVKSTESTLRRKKQALESLQKNLKQNEIEMVSPSTGTNRRIELLAEIHDLVRKRDTIKTDIHRLERELVKKRQRLASLKRDTSLAQ